MGAPEAVTLEAGFPFAWLGVGQAVLRNGPEEASHSEGCKSSGLTATRITA